METIESAQLCRVVLYPAHAPNAPILAYIILLVAFGKYMDD
jgi:hypothetical protein